ncbi:MAG TPA: DUF2089 domain-containing protein [Spirochaetia bacterium]|nr:DUF2089 domain-containing protein [Spirochaetia bacterium]
MERKLLQDCPVCGSTLKVHVLQCPSCNTRIEGDFEPPQSKILYLSKKDLDFVEIFVRVRGNIKEMEKALGVSYPTVRGMLDGVIEKMGYPARRGLDPKRRKEIIDRLEKGEISADEAAAMLKAGDTETAEE